jgi:hypothetical protein
LPGSSPSSKAASPVIAVAIAAATRAGVLVAALATAAAAAASAAPVFVRSVGRRKAHHLFTHCLGEHGRGRQKPPEKDARAKHFVHLRQQQAAKRETQLAYYFK